jgi:PAS domain S-box-containing protein
MSGAEFRSAWLNDPRLTAHALSPTPVWLWSTDATGMLWGNPTAAAIFDAASPGALALLRFEPTHVSAAQIARLSGTLPHGGAPRLERLRGFGASFGGTLVCLCSRIVLPDNSSAILVVSTERAGKDLSMPERAHRLLADFAKPAAIFSADGELIDATPAAGERMGSNRDLIALGAQGLAGEASRNGRADGEIAAGPIGVHRLGAGGTVALLVTFETVPSGSHAGARASDAAAAIAASTAPNRASAQSGARKLPYRFLWQMDADTRFTQGIEEFAGLIGSYPAVLNRPWANIADALKLDNQGEIARALTARETWSGIVTHWPVDGSNERLPIEMSGLPVFDRDRQFEGFRGFAICRDAERLAEVNRAGVPASNEPPVNVLAFRAPLPVEPAPVPAVEPPSALTPGEHSAFEELARELNARLKKSIGQDTASVTPDDFDVEPAPFVEAAPPAPPPPELLKAARNGDSNEARPILDRLPIGILVYRLNNLVYANRSFLDWTGYPTLEALTEAGGLDSLFIESKTAEETKAAKTNAKTLTITTVNGKQRPVDGRLLSVSWNNENALALIIHTQTVSDERAKTTEVSLLRIEGENHELRAILDTATDGVLVLDRAGRVLSANASAQALFGYDGADFTDLMFGDLFAPESRRSVLDYLDRLARGAAAGILEPGCDAIGRVRQGGLVPLYLTIGRIEDGEKLCAVLRDVTAWKRTEEELIKSRQQAERASTAKSEFLAKISHEIRTPLNAIIGFSEVMMDERFGPVGNDRYRQYLRDIHASGGHLISLLNDLLDLSKIEAGKLELSFVSVNLNDLVQQCVAIMQEQANKERVIIRTSLPANLPQIVADARSVRQIALNLLSNSIKFTGAGGQVIVSTAVNDDNEVVLRVRDTGVGMTEKELETALEPFRQLATSARWGASGTGLGLPITKALAEANHARFAITSEVDDGTLVEVAFPATRVLAE